MRKTEVLYSSSWAHIAAAGRALTEAPFHFQRFRQYPSGACGGATGQMQPELALSINKGKLFSHNLSFFVQKGTSILNCNL